jgi:mannitol/fructose-specific phosphotransferase system IIA component (Ntr-type)
MFKQLLKKFTRGSQPSFSTEHIVTDLNSTTREQALQFIADRVAQAGYVRNAEAFFQDLLDREARSTTGFKDHIATPHAKSSQVLHAGIWVVRFAHDIPWQTMDDRPVRVAVALVIPAKDNDAVMLPLVAISRANMKAEFRHILNTGNDEAIDQAIRQAIGGQL